jgi:hypothetical protein
MCFGLWFFLLSIMFVNPSVLSKQTDLTFCVAAFKKSTTMHHWQQREQPCMNLLQSFDFLLFLVLIAVFEQLNQTLKADLLCLMFQMQD